MENIFDFNPTETELKRFGGIETFEIAKEHGFYDKLISGDNNLYMLGLLFAMRGDKAKANHYFGMIENKDLLCTLVQDF